MSHIKLAKKAPKATRVRVRVCMYMYTRAVCKVLGLAAVRRCYAEGGDDCYANL
jgi:hypothetical protein